jgi:hypothetical protein
MRSTSRRSFLTEECSAQLGLRSAPGRLLLPSPAWLRPRLARQSQTGFHRRRSVPARHAERRQITIMFTRPRRLDEAVAGARSRDYKGVMQAYRAACGPVARHGVISVSRRRHRGVFGWPAARGGPRSRAVRAGRNRRAVAYGSNPRYGSGSRGIVVIARGGQRRSVVPSGAVGDTPNIAARLRNSRRPAPSSSPGDRRLISARSLRAARTAVQGIATDPRVPRP